MTGPTDFLPSQAQRDRVLPACCTRVEEVREDVVARPAPVQPVVDRVRAWLGWFGVDRLTVSAVSMPVFSRPSRAWAQRRPQRLWRSEIGTDRSLASTTSSGSRASAQPNLLASVTWSQRDTVRSGDPDQKSASPIEIVARPSAMPAPTQMPPANHK